MIRSWCNFSFVPTISWKYNIPLAEVHGGATVPSQSRNGAAWLTLAALVAARPALYFPPTARAPASSPVDVGSQEGIYVTCGMLGGPCAPGEVGGRLRHWLRPLVHGSCVVLGPGLLACMLCLGAIRWLQWRRPNERVLMMLDALACDLRRACSGKQRLLKYVPDAVEMVRGIAMNGHVRLSWFALCSYTRGTHLAPAAIEICLFVLDPSHSMREKLCHESFHILIAIKKHVERSVDWFAMESQFSRLRRWRIESMTLGYTEPKGFLRGIILQPARFTTRAMMRRPWLTWAVLALLLLLLCSLVGWLSGG